MAAPIVYRWDDSGAPVARGERASLCDILYACLVTGYGTKPAAGWTREFVNATFDKAVFRNNPVTGTGFYLQVDGAGAVNAYTPVLQAYETMTSVDSGLLPFNAATQKIETSSTANTTARPWILIADALSFYFVCWLNITTTPTDSSVIVGTMFFGDIVKRFPDDQHACGLTAAGSSGLGSYGQMSLSNTAAGTLGGNGIAMPRKSSGVAGSVVAANIRGGGPGADNNMGNIGHVYSPGDQIIIARPYVNDATGYTMRGWLPGLYYPCHSLAFGQFANIESDGKSFLSLRHNSPSGQVANYFIDLGDWRA